MISSGEYYSYSFRTVNIRSIRIGYLYTNIKVEIIFIYNSITKMYKEINWSFLILVIHYKW